MDSVKILLLLCFLKSSLCSSCDLRNLHCSDVADAYRCAFKLVMSEKVSQHALDDQKFSVAPTKPNFDMYENKTNTFPTSRVLLKTSQLLHEKYNEIHTPTSKYEFYRWLDEKNFCFPRNIKNNPCKNRITDQYRTFDGACNNLRKWNLGASMTPYSRLTWPDYHDDVYEIRQSVLGGKLPIPRKISNFLFRNNNKMLDNLIHPVPNMAAAIFGQFIAHDIGKRINTEKDNKNSEINCCSGGGLKQLPTMSQHSACLPIELDKFDPIYSKHSIKCLNFVRSQTVIKEPRKLGFAAQVNTVSNYLDNSNLYGSDDATIDSLRLYNYGLIKINKNLILPEIKNCSTNSCYILGDDRLNQTPTLALLHSLFLRLHNQIALRLHQTNPHWNDERIFQESRRIVIAIYQKITYKEWLPIILGQSYSEMIKINRPDHYSSNVSSSITNEFSNALFRSFHSLIPATVHLYDKSGKLSKLSLSDIVLNSKLLEKYYNDIGRGLLWQKINLEGYNEEILSNLFKKGNKPGIDLLSIDIQRGRDHGIAPYVNYRHMCHLKPVSSFSDLHPEISSENIAKLESLYKSVHDIDLLVGALLEKRNGEFFGPTLKCIFGEQFYRLKKGDRFFYNHHNSPNPFTEGQLKEIHKFSAAYLFCKNSDIEFVQKNAFLALSKDTEYIACDQLPEINYNYWKENADRKGK